MSQRAALAFGSDLIARIDARRRKDCTVVLDEDRVTSWSVPNERLRTPGPWRRGAQVETDEAPVHGIVRPGAPYDWRLEVVA